MARFCTQCGKPIQEGSKFCANCGAPVKEIPQKEVVQEAVKPTEYVDENVGTFRKETVQQAGNTLEQSIQALHRKVEEGVSSISEAVTQTDVPDTARTTEQRPSAVQIRPTDDLNTGISAIPDKIEAAIQQVTGKDSTVVRDVKRKYFISVGRLDRGSYFLRYFLVLILFFVFSGITSTGIGAIIGFPVAMACTVAAIMLQIRRCHDLGWSGWAVVVGLIPGVNIIFALILFFMKGTDGPNKYGPDPLR